MPNCTHPVGYLHLQVRVNPHTLAPETHMICDSCGKDIQLDAKDVFLWMKTLELRDMLTGVVHKQNLLDPFGDA